MQGEKEGHGQNNQSIDRNLPPALADDNFYRALASKYRRRVLYYLIETESTTVGELATALSGWEATTTGTMQSHADRNKIYLALVHNHLPQLANAGLIDDESHTDSIQLQSLHPQVIDLIRQSVKAGQLSDA